MAFSWNISDHLVCADLPVLAIPSDICFPGGACLSAIITNIQTIPSPSDVLLSYFAQLGPAMQFMNPFFVQLETILAVFKCIEGITDFATSLDPSGVIECVPNLIEKVNNLLNLIPQLSIPRMIIALVSTVASLLRAIAHDLEFILLKFQEIAEAIDEAADMNNVKLNELLACSQADLDAQVMTTADALKGIGRIILLINIFLGLIGGPEIPCFGQLLSDTDALEPAVDLLREMANLLDELLAMIPDPQAAITAALGGQTC